MHIALFCAFSLLVRLTINSLLIPLDNRILACVLRRWCPPSSQETCPTRDSHEWLSWRRNVRPRVLSPRRSVLSAPVVACKGSAGIEDYNAITHINRLNCAIFSIDSVHLYLFAIRYRYYYLYSPYLMIVIYIITTCNRLRLCNRFES